MIRLHKIKKNKSGQAVAWVQRHWLRQYVFFFLINNTLILVCVFFFTDEPMRLRRAFDRVPDQTKRARAFGGIDIEPAIITIIVVFTRADGLATVVQRVTQTTAINNNNC